MALDKAVDSALLDAGLTQVAQGIREATGNAGSMTFPEGMVEQLQSIGPVIWGKKLVGGSFQLSETTSEAYLFAAEADGVLQGLLEEGESWADIYETVGVVLMRQATTSFFPSKNLSAFGAALRLVVTKTISYGIRQYWNASGTSSAMNGGITVSKTGISAAFAAACQGYPTFVYNWMAWRHI